MDAAFAQGGAPVGARRSAFHGTVCARSTKRAVPYVAAAPTPSAHTKVRLPPTMGKGRNSRYRSMPSSGQNAMAGAPEIPEDGTPLFTIVVRSRKGARIWYPCGGFKGDKRSRTLMDAMKTGWGKRLYGRTLDRGVAQSVFRKGGDKRMLSNAFRQFPALRQHADDLEFGYRTVTKDSPMSDTKIIEKELAMPFFQWFRYKYLGGPGPQ